MKSGSTKTKALVLAICVLFLAAMSAVCLASTTTYSVPIGTGAADLVTGSVAGWSEDIRLTTTPVYSKYPVIAIDTNNNAHITWQDKRHVNYEIYYTKLDNNGNTLVDDTRLTTDSAGSQGPAIAVDTNNNVHITWYDLSIMDLNYEIYYTKLDNNGNTLVDDTRLTTDPAFSFFPAIAVDTNNNVHIIWEDWWEGGEPEIYYTKLDNNGNTVVDDTRLTDSGTSQGPTIAVDTNNNVHITWHDYRDGNCAIYYTKLDNNGNTLVDDTRLTTASSGSYYPTIAVDTNNNVHITWYDWGDDWGSGYYYFSEIYYTKLDNNGNTLVDDTRLTTMDSADSEGPTIAVDTSNNVHITWWDRRDGYPPEIYYTKLDNNGNTLVDDTRLTTASADSWDPEIAVDTNNNVHITWYDERDGSYPEIYYKHSIASTPTPTPSPTPTPTLPVHNFDTGEYFATIQAAINDSDTLNGHMITVDSGTYTENVNVNKQLILRGIDTGGGKPVVDAGGSGNAITLSADGITLEGFTATNSGDWKMGIKVTSNDNTITGNNASNNYRGIYLYYFSNSNIITGNTASNNNCGIYLYSSSSNTITGNTASNNSYGIYLYSSSNNNITGNTVSNNSRYGIYIYSYCDNNTITGNTASNNNGEGIYLLSSSSNLIYDNYFNNSNNAVDDGNNIWNITKTEGTNIIGGSWLGGNYWSDYAGVDLDGDCLGDTLLPYSEAITNGGDYLPLVSVGVTPTSGFDTGPGTYPSISGTHTGTIKPNQTISVSKLYTYPCSGTGGHTESVEIYENETLIANGTWSGYIDDWNNITFATSFTLEAGETYNYTIRTGSYPQIIHAKSKDVTEGTITCTEFVDANGKAYNDWIPAIRLE